MELAVSSTGYNKIISLIVVALIPSVTNGTTCNVKFKPFTKSKRIRSENVHIVPIYQI